MLTWVVLADTAEVGLPEPVYGVGRARAVLGEENPPPKREPSVHVREVEWLLAGLGGDAAFVETADVERWKRENGALPPESHVVLLSIAVFAQLGDSPEAASVVRGLAQRFGCADLGGQEELASTQSGTWVLAWDLLHMLGGKFHNSAASTPWELDGADASEDDEAYLVRIAKTLPVSPEKRVVFATRPVMPHALLLAWRVGGCERSRSASLDHALRRNAAWGGDVRFRACLVGAIMGARSLAS